MKILGICLTLIINSLWLYAQRTQSHLFIQDTLGNPISAARIAYHDSEEKVKVTDATYLDGHVFVDRNFSFLTIWKMGYEIAKIKRTDITHDKTIVHLRNIRYDCPQFIIMKSGGFKMDTSKYINEIADLKVSFDSGCASDSVIDNNGNILIEVCDTVKVAYSCKLATPVNGYADYYKRLHNLFKQFTTSELGISDFATIDFFVDREGRMKTEKVSGINSEFTEHIFRTLDNLWRPADMWGQMVVTHYRITIRLE